MRKSFKKFVVFTMTCMLALTPVTAFAAEGDIEEAPATGDASGSGEIEGIVNKDVFCVTLPTIDDSADTFDFILDPQGLIAATTGGSLGSSTYEDGASLLFHNSADDATTDYSSQSDVVEILNKSTFDVDVTVTAEVSDLTDATAEAEGTYAIVMKDSDSYTSDTDTSMYLALDIDGTETAITADGATATKKIDKVPEGSYEVTYTSEDGYQYTLKDSVTEFPKAELSLTGSCNTTATVDWEAAKNATPGVELTWSVDKHVDGPSIAITTAGVVTFSNLTAEKNVDATKIVTYGTASNTTPSALNTANVTFNTDNWTAADGGTLIMTLADGYKTFYAGDTMVLKATLSDGSTITGSVTFPE